MFGRMNQQSLLGPGPGSNTSLSSTTQSNYQQQLVMLTNGNNNQQQQHHQQMQQQQHHQYPNHNTNNNRIPSLGTDYRMNHQQQYTNNNAQQPPPPQSLNQQHSFQQQYQNNYNSTYQPSFNNTPLINSLIGKQTSSLLGTPSLNNGSGNGLLQNFNQNNLINKPSIYNLNNNNMINKRRFTPASSQQVSKSVVKQPQTQPPPQPTSEEYKNNLNKLKICMESNRRNINQRLNVNQIKNENKPSLSSNSTTSTSTLVSNSSAQSSTTSSSSTNASKTFNSNNRLQNKQLIIIKPCENDDQILISSEKVNKISENGDDTSKLPIKRSHSPADLNNKKQCLIQDTNENESLQIDLALESNQEPGTPTKDEINYPNQNDLDQPVIAVHGVLSGKLSEEKFPIDAFYCKYCCLLLNEEKHIKQHLTTILHKSKTTNQTPTATLSPPIKSEEKAKQNVKNE